jgi:non-canonical purine NTP pyrophosphatase (RdgB/HAM1 family)
VESSDIVAVGYDPKTRVLEVEFQQGRVYQYIDVEPDTHRLLMKADSVGTYFQSSIMGHYRYKRLENIEQRPAFDSLAFVTGNARKFRDLQAACAPFDIPVEQLALPVVEIQSHDPEEIAAAKAKQAYKLAGRPVIVNDTYWNFIALRGFPGAFMSYVTEWLRPEDFLTLMKDKTDRTVSCTDTLVYYDGKRSKVFGQTTWGKVATAVQGNGQSISQVVIIDGEQKTIAEVEEREGRSCIDPDNNLWVDFAKWYKLQRRLGKA